MSKIEYRTLNDRAYDEIKSSLIAGQFRPGQVLVIRTLADRYGISTTPVREALQRLVGERQLVMLHNRSIAVPGWDPAKFQELFRIRCALEGLAAELAATQMTERDVETMERLTDEIALALRQGREAGLPVGNAGGASAAAVQASVDAGFTFTMMSNDASLLGGAARAAVEAGRTVRFS